MNILIIKGRLTADPELRQSTTSGNNFCTFSVAVNRTRQKDATDFISCTAFGKTAEFISKYFTKGKEICCRGELHIDKYDKNGESRTSTRCVVDSAEFCGGRTDSAEVTYPSSGAALQPTEEDDELPF